MVMRVDEFSQQVFQQCCFFFVEQVCSYKKICVFCGGGLNLIFRGDELEGEEFQNNDGFFVFLMFLYVVIFVVIVQWIVGILLGFEIGLILFSLYVLYIDNICVGGDYFFYFVGRVVCFIYFCEEDGV